MTQPQTVTANQARRESLAFRWAILDSFRACCSRFRLGFASFFLATFLAIFTLLFYNEGGHHNVDFADTYKFVGLPVGLVVLSVSLLFFGSSGFGARSLDDSCMALVTIPVESLLDGRRPGSETQAREWCAQLEAGEILFFPRTPIEFASGDLEFLLGQQQTDSSLHKNIAYKPMQDALSGVDTKTADAAAVMRLQLIMRWYSAAVEGFLSEFLRLCAALEAGLCEFSSAGRAGSRPGSAQAQRFAAYRCLSDAADAWGADSALLQQYPSDADA